MTASNFTDMRCKVGTSLLEKLDELMRAAASIRSISRTSSWRSSCTSVNRNLSFLRPNFAKTVADRVRSLGKPSSRTARPRWAAAEEALEHMTAANENGFL